VQAGSARDPVPQLRGAQRGSQQTSRPAENAPLKIRCGRQANVAGKFDFVSKTRNKRNDRARHICVDQKAHGALSGGKWVKRLLLGKLADESERRSNIINSQIVLTLNFFKGHPPGEAPNHDRHWNTRTTNDGFPVANSRIYNDAVPRLHGDPNSTDFAQLVEISVDCLPHLSEGSSEFWPSTLPSQVWLR
jgi:hypothetical protein